MTTQQLLEGRPRARLMLAGTLAAIGAPLWWRFWGDIRSLLEDSFGGEPIRSLTPFET